MAATNKDIKRTDCLTNKPIDRVTKVSKDSIDDENERMGVDDWKYERKDLHTPLNARLDRIT